METYQLGKFKNERERDRNKFLTYNFGLNYEKYSRYPNFNSSIDKLFYMLGIWHLLEKKNAKNEALGYLVVINLYGVVDVETFTSTVVVILPSRLRHYGVRKFS